MIYCKGWTSEIKPRRTPFAQAPRTGLQFFTLKSRVSYLLDPKKGEDIIAECLEKIPMGYAQLFIYEHVGAFSKGKRGILGWPPGLVKPQPQDYQQPQRGKPQWSSLNRRKWAGNLYFAFREPNHKTTRDSWLIGTTTDRTEALFWAYQFAKGGSRRAVVGKLVGDVQWH